MLKEMAVVDVFGIRSDPLDLLTVEDFGEVGISEVVDLVPNVPVIGISKVALVTKIVGKTGIRVDFLVI